MFATPNRADDWRCIRLLGGFRFREWDASRWAISSHARRHSHRGGGVAVSDTVVSLLTPVGVGAIATIELWGPKAWGCARQLFRPAGKPLPDSPELHRFWFGTLGEGAGDEVILAVTGVDRLEIHCHGGRRVVQWIIDQFRASEVCLPYPLAGEGKDQLIPASLLQHAPTLRTASILLDQLHGAFDNAVRRVLELFRNHTPYPVLLTEFSDLVRFAPLGRHLVEPWKVVVAGPPNVGKSSLVNALAGYQRAVVSEIAGTTRDVVSVQLAFDGWPVELTDTAGLRAAEGLEAEGIDLARREVAEADLVLWVMDGNASRMVWPSADIPIEKLATLINKADAMVGSRPDLQAGCLLVSATTGQGLPQLVKWITTQFVPEPPPPGVAVPYTPELASIVTAAYLGLVQGNGNQSARAEAIRLLREALGQPG
ncbi:MAG: hypothetical protein C0467_20900 [Planctomycetaceae bacterium]|nr:hypothetical protein [Planctomycetaceae bacterium]